MTKQKVDDDQKLTRLIEEFIDKGANTAEEINRAVLDLPVTVLDSLGLEDTANEVKKVQDSSIGAIYNLIHEINHKVADLATDLLEQRRGNGK
jgi:phosphopentomutase